MRKPANVVAFVEDERAQGKSDQEIRHQLLDAGWHMDIVQHAMGEKHAPTPKIHNVPTKKTKTPKPKNWQEKLEHWRQHDTTQQLIKSPVFWASVFASLILIALFI